MAVARVKAVTLAVAAVQRVQGLAVMLTLLALLVVRLGMVPEVVMALPPEVALVVLLHQGQGLHREVAVEVVLYQVSVALVLRAKPNLRILKG